eukprot:TRINITY_DN25904_c0_g1_i1.p1 TRINITY_DN25904_c0_g1~~TRINITY_DN25904_c0_g1_i1.p1  ORF type:complete len:389 (-),score=102.21 TRINITY_DN25904_c0_g1_i1:20-1186(-)
MMEPYAPRSGYNIQQIVSELVDCATVKMDALNDSDWETNMKICDLINAEPESYCIVVAKQLQKQMKSYSKNPRVMYLTLILLETCVKNCGPFFHKEIATKEFIKTFKRTAAKRVKKKKFKKGGTLSARDYHTDRIDDKALRMIQSFGRLNRHELYPYLELYERYRKKGVIFPNPEPEDATPEKVEARKALVRSAQGAQGANLPTDIREKVEEIKSVITVLESIIQAEQGQDLSQNELAMELRQNCENQRGALTDLIQKYSNAEDESHLNVLLLLFDRVEKVLLQFDGNAFAERDFTNSDGSYSDDKEDHEPAKLNPEPPKPNRGQEPSQPQPQPFADTNPFRNEIAAKQGQGGVYRTPEEIGLDLLASIKSKEAPKRSEDPLLDWLLH